MACYCDWDEHRCPHCGWYIDTLSRIDQIEHRDMHHAEWKRYGSAARYLQTMGKTGARKGGS